MRYANVTVETTKGEHAWEATATAKITERGRLVQAETGYGVRASRLSAIAEALGALAHYIDDDVVIRGL